MRGMSGGDATCNRPTRLRPTRSSAGVSTCHQASRASAPAPNRPRRPQSTTAGSYHGSLARRRGRAGRAPAPTPRRAGEPPTDAAAETSSMSHRRRFRRIRRAEIPMGIRARRRRKSSRPRPSCTATWKRVRHNNSATTTTRQHITAATTTALEQHLRHVEAAQVAAQTAPAVLLGARLGCGFGICRSIEQSLNRRIVPRDALAMGGVLGE